MSEQIPPPRQDFGELMNCTICLDVPASPINSCANGHIICGVCVDQIKKCGLCKSPKLNVNNFAERLSRQLELKLTCRNQHSGCNEIIPAAVMKLHLEICNYRDIICTEWKNGTCGKTKVPMTEYAKHLHDKHKCFKPPATNWTLVLKKDKEFEPAGFSYPAGILEHDGNSFLLLSHICSNAVYFWMTVLGSKEKAEKYLFEFKLCKTMEGGKQLDVSWTIPVLAFQDRPKYVEGGSFYVTISLTMAKEFGIRKPKDKFKRSIYTSYRIL